MRKVTAAWILDRGGFHDARVIAVRVEGSVAEIEFDDEWANQRGLDFPEGEEAPGTLVVEGIAAATGELCALAGGWISYVELRGDILDLAFCDRPQLILPIGAAWWRSAIQKSN